MLEIKRFGVCHLAVAPLRIADSDASEIVSQLLFGDLVHVLEVGKPWIKIRCAVDGYEGWMDFKQLTYISEEEFETLQTAKTNVLKKPIAQITGPDLELLIMLGSKLHNFDGKSIHFGDKKFHFKVAPNQQEESIKETAIHYLNAPYLWGGRSLFGIDCSGFTQNVFSIHKIQLQRDACQQVFEGELIPYEDRKIGDVPFFINAKGTIHHVGILIEKDQIIHAAGSIRIDPFDKKGIFRVDFADYTHHYHSIRRFK